MALRLALRKTLTSRVSPALPAALYPVATIPVQSLSWMTLATTRRSFAEGPAAVSSSTDAAAATPPSVMDQLIKLVIVDPSGARRNINGMIGTTLYEACETNEVELGPVSHAGPSQIIHSERWTEPVFGEGPTSGYDHVVVSNVGNAAMSPMTRPERRMLEDYWDFDELFPESRLASQIKLSKEMDGMIVYVPARVDDSNP